MNKLIKGCVIGGIVYGLMEVGYTLGKGNMLGILKAYGVSATDCVDALSEDNRKKSKFMAKFANIRANYLKSKIES